MMNISNKVKIGIVILGILFLAGIVFLLSRRPHIATAPPPPQITSYVEQELPIQITFSKKDYNFPPTLPLLNVTPSISITLNEAKDLANKFGFQGEPQNLKDIQEGIVYFWSNENAGLSIRPNKKEIKYTTNQVPLPSRFPLAETELVAKAANFLTQKNLLDPESTKTAFVNYYKTQVTGTEGAKLTTHDQATFAEVNFSTKISNYKLLTLDPLSSPLKVRVYLDGTITEVDATKLPTIAESTASYKIKNYDEFLSSIKEAKIVSLDEGRMVSPDTNNNPITNVNASSVELVYLLDASNSNYYQPVFLIKGAADIENIGKGISAYLYLPALSSQP